MAIDFTTMDGYQFEDYVSNIFRKLGFEVEATNYSNDGGVDLIATFKQPIFSGKYIIQCKNWTVPVGQPEVRDLYGVVMDQRANKGILITPSDYTQQAYDFANGKNIELINGTILSTIIGEDAKNSLDSISRGTKFRNDRYLYYQKNITDEPNNVRNYLQMIRYLREYMKEQNDEMCTMELFDDIIFWTDKLINRCFKTASKTSDKEVATLFKVEALIHTGRLAEATEYLLRIRKFRLHNLHGCEWSNDSMQMSSLNSVLSWNLFAAFKHIHYMLGCGLIIAKLNDSEGGLKKSYYDTNIFGNFFIYPSPRMEPIGTGKTEHLSMSVFKKTDIKDPTFFYKKFYKKPPEEYSQEIDMIFKLHGLM